MSPEQYKKFDALTRILKGYGSAVVCFSGGVDSALLLKATHDALGDMCHGMTAVSVTMAKSEQRQVREIAEAIGAPLELIASNELGRPGFAENPENRCYHCKTELMTWAARLRIV